MAKRSVSKEIDETTQKTRKLEDTLKGLEMSTRSPLQAIINKFREMGAEGNNTAKILVGAFSLIAVSIATATRASQNFIKTLGSIKGINGNLGELAKAITTAATGSVSRQDIADFLSATSDLFTSAQAQTNQLGLIRNLIAAYGDVTVAANKFRNITMLSAESQAAMVTAIEKQAQAMENTPEGKLIAAQKALQEIVVTIGTDLMEVLRPAFALVSSFADALRALSKQSSSRGTRAEALKEELELTEAETKALQELSDLERSGFTTSLDEVHATGVGFISEDDSVLGLNSAKVDNITSSFDSLKESMSDVAGTLALIWHTFSDMLAQVGPGLLDLFAWVVDIAAGFITWANNAGILKPLLIAVAGAITAIKIATVLSNIAQRQNIAAISEGVGMLTAQNSALAANTAFLGVNTAAKGANAAAGIAAAGASTFGVAVPIILAAIGAGIAGLAAMGIFSGGGSGGTSSNVSNTYSGTMQETQRAQVNVYLDGKKVNDELANSRYYDEEVVIG